MIKWIKKFLYNLVEADKKMQQNVIDKIKKLEKK